VYEYVADVSGALGELRRRVLRPGGVHINRYIFLAAAV
jgi:hypothetical protein